MARGIRPGSVVAFWDGGDLRVGAVAAAEKHRLRLIADRGDEVRVAASRVFLEVERREACPSSTVEERRRVGERMAAVAERARARGRDVDVNLLWEIASEAESGDGGVSLIDTEDLARLAMDDGAGEACLAVVWVLLADGIHFTRKGDAWQPRAAEAVSRLRLERDRVTRREREQRDLFSLLEAVATGRPVTLTGGELERQTVHALEQLAMLEEAAPESVRNVATEALRASGLRSDRPHEGAFRLLRLLGRYSSDDENLQVRRLGLRESFPSHVSERARTVSARGARDGGRIDLTELDVISIDGAQTREIDDALSIERIGSGGFRLGIHIADPAAFIDPGDPVDHEALARTLTHYFPERRIPMLPPDLSERSASLEQGETRPAMSFLVELDELGRVIDCRLSRSRVRSRARLDYGQADRMIREGCGPWTGPLESLARMARVREMLRIEAGAVPIHAPEVDVYVGEDGSIFLERIESDSEARRIVTEAMILAGELASGICVASRVPVIFRRQDPPAAPVEVSSRGIVGPVEARAARRSLRRAEVSLEPGRHHSLGLDAYTQVTSPLRRFQDLTTQRQILAAVEGVPPPHDDEAIQIVAATTERAEAEARIAERSCRTFWLLRYLESRTGERLEGTVVDLIPRPVILLEETLLEQPMPSLKGAEPGERVHVRVERVNPRAGLLVLRRD